jgi:hypothetical protein
MGAMSDEQLGKWLMRALYGGVFFFLIISGGHSIWWFSLVCLVIGHFMALSDERAEAKRYRERVEPYLWMDK